MAGWLRVGPLRGLVLIPVTIRDESRRTRRVEAEGHGSKDRGATTSVMELDCSVETHRRTSITSVPPDSVCDCLQAKAS